MKVTSINPDVLRWARLKSNVTDDQIVITMGDERYKEWEKGEDFPTYVQLEKLMFLYKFPVAVSFYPELPEYDDPKINFRTLPNEIIDGIDFKIIRLFNKAKSYQLNLIEIDSNDEFSISKNVIEYYRKLRNMDTIMKELRLLPQSLELAETKIKTPKDYFDYWRDELFEKGVFIFKDSFGDESISGFSIYDKKYPVIYINNSMSHTRQLFTLFHELYHIILGTNGIDFTHDEFLDEYNYDLTLEYECNKFSGEFLVPREKLELMLVNYEINVENIGIIAKKFFVSRDVVLRRLLDIGAIDFGYYSDHMGFFRNDYRRQKRASSDARMGDYYNNQMAYLGRKYLELTFKAYYRNIITISELGRYTNMKYQSLKEIANRKHWGEL